MRFSKRKKTWIYVIIGLLLCAIVGGCVYAFVGTDDKDKTVNISASEFSLGGLNDKGEYIETKESIYTKDAFKCQGLTVTPEFESQVTYQIFFYDELGEFVNKTASLEKAYRDDIPAGAYYARIVITPNKDEDGSAIELNVFKVSKYAKQITITVNKEQKTFIEEIKSLDNQAVLFGTGVYDNSKGTLSASSTSPFYFYSPIDCSKANIAIVYLKCLF